jgi:hypothetical protein
MDSCSCLPISMFWKENPITCRTLKGLLDVLLKRLNGCNLEWFEAFGHKWEFG